MLNANQIANQFTKRTINRLVSAYKRTLIAFRKVATKTVYNSIRGESDVSENRITIRIKADEGLSFIQSGKRANTRLPVKKTSSGFVLFPRIKAWANAVGFGGSDFILARAIARNEIKGVDITGNVLENEQRVIIEDISNSFAELVRTQAINDIKATFKTV